MNFKLFWKYIKFDNKRHFFMNIFASIQLLFLIIVLTLTFSNQLLAKVVYSKKYGSPSYKDITVRTMSDEEINKYNLNEKEVLGSMKECGHLNDEFDKYVGGTVFADKFVFDYFKLPLVKGRYPTKQGEALASWTCHDRLEIGNYYKVNVDDNIIDIKIVGFTQGRIGYAMYGNIFDTFGESNDRISILWNDIENLYSSSRVSTKDYIKMSAEEVDDFYNNNNPGVAINWLSNINTKYEIEYYGNAHVRLFFVVCLLFVISITVVVVFSNVLINKLNNNLERAVCIFCGQTKFNMMLSVIIKNVITFLIGIGISFIPTYFSEKVGNFDFALTYKGWSIAITLGFIIISIITAINSNIIKKQNICETLNTVN